VTHLFGYLESQRAPDDVIEERAPVRWNASEFFREEVESAWLKGDGRATP
jgi:hypothetical protein